MYLLLVEEIESTVFVVIGTLSRVETYTNDLVDQTFKGLTLVRFGIDVG